MLRRLLTVSFVLLALLLPEKTHSLALALEIPTVYVGSHGQAAVAFASNHDKRPQDAVKIVEVWKQADDTLYFATESAPEHVYRWIAGDTQVTVWPRSELPENAESVSSSATLEGLPYPSILKDIAWSIPLSQNRLAVVSAEGGISIMNTQMPQTTLYLDSWILDLAPLCFCFQMANSDIRLEETQQKRYVGGGNADFNYLRIPLTAFIPEHPGMTDIYVAEIREARRAAQAGVLADLSGSAELRETAAQRLPAFQEYCGMYSVPYLLEVMIWWVNMEEWVKTDESFPSNVNALFLLYDRLLDRLEKGEFSKYALRSLFDEDYVLASSLMSQYVMQYASVTEPLSFEAPAFRNIMVGLRTRYDRQKKIEATLPVPADCEESKDIMEACEYNRYPFSKEAGTPFSPLSIEGNQNPYFYATAEVLVVDVNTTALPEALRFLEFVSEIRSSDILLLSDFDEQSKLPAPSTIDFYNTEVFPRLEFHDADIYFDPVAGLDFCSYYSPSEMLYEYLNGWRDDLDDILRELTSMAAKRYSEFFPK